MHQRAHSLNRRLRHLGAWLLVSAALVLSSTLAFATVAIYMDMPSLVERSQVIVHGEVVSQQSTFDKARQLSLLQTTIKVKHAYLGEPGKELIVQQLGGEHEGNSMKIAGDAIFKEKEQVVLFLNKGEDKLHYLTSLGQSKFTIRAEGKTVFVERDLTGFVFMKPGVKGSQEIKEEPVKLRSFTKELEQTIATIKGSKK